MPQPKLSRRHAILASASLPLAAPALLRGTAAVAQSTPQPESPMIAPYHRVNIGGFQVTTLLAGTRAGDKPQETFGLNASSEEFTALSQANFIPDDKSFNYFTPTLLDTGSELILFDTGMDPSAMTGALASAGIAPDRIGTVVLTHMHGDHIGGLSDDAGKLTFPNARYVTGAVEYDHWSKQGNETFDAKVRLLSEKMTFLDDGGEVTAGVTALAAPGHTPGHFAYRIENGGAQLLLLADTTNHYVWSLQRPDWEVRFDADKAQAATTRRKLLGELAADRLPFIGYHMPFPAIGYVEAHGDGFRYVPASYQLML